MDAPRPDVVLVEGGNPGPYSGAGTNTYLLPGRAPLLIDAATGLPGFLESLSAALRDRCGPEGQREPLRVLVTHAHRDHVGGCAAIARRWPDTRFFKQPWPSRDARAAVPFTPLRDEEVVTTGTGPLRAVHTPGHAPDHLCFLDVRTRTLFSGDLAVKGGTIMIPAADGGSLASYLGSLRRVLALRPFRLLPAHGLAIEDPAALIEEYLAHRAERERQILEALGGGGAAPETIVRAVYPALPPALQEAARQTVLAHLIKLHDERRVVRAGALWKIGTTVL